MVGGGEEGPVSGCRFGYEEHDGSRYCYEHYGFWEPGTPRGCDRMLLPLPPQGFASTPPLAEANGGRTCSTCNGGGCPDCTEGG